MDVLPKERKAIQKQTKPPKTKCSLHVG